MKRQSESLEQSSTVRPVISVRRTLVYLNGNANLSAAVLCGSTLDQMSHSYAVEPETKCCNLMCVDQ